MITLKTKGYNVYVSGVNLKGISMILDQEKQFLVEFNSQWNKITDKEYSPIEVFDIPLLCMKETKEKVIFALCEDENWRITMEEYLSLYDEVK